MGRRRYTREFKLEALNLIRERGVSVKQASLDLGIHENTLRAWLKEFEADPQHSFPGHGQMKPEQGEVARLRRDPAGEIATDIIAAKRFSDAVHPPITKIILADQARLGPIPSMRILARKVYN
jgi:transposase